MDNKRLIKSYVWHDGRCYFVSTIDRDSSAIYGDRYAETLVWEYDWETGERGKIVAEDGAGQGNINQHFEICKSFYLTGEYNTE